MKTFEWLSNAGGFPFQVQCCLMTTTGSHNPADCFLNTLAYARDIPLKRLAALDRLIDEVAVQAGRLVVNVEIWWGGCVRIWVRVVPFIRRFLLNSPRRFARM